MEMMEKMDKFTVNGNMYYTDNPHVSKNIFLNMEAEKSPLPSYDKDSLPKPFWQGHEDAIACYDKAWQIAFSNLRTPNGENGFVSNFIDTAFNGFLFMWDSAFIVMFGKYAERVFNFQKTLDNLYAHQHKDGFICREICEEDGREQWSRDDPSSTGPNVLPWAEWEYYLSHGDTDRLSKVFDPLVAYHKWLQLNRTWQDGSYWSTGFACGMDNQPRTDEYDECLSHGFLSWIDACAQQYLSATILVKMAAVLGREDEVKWLENEAKLLRNTVNNTMWDSKNCFYYDKKRDGSLSEVMTVGAYWTLLADLVPAERLDSFVAHLDNEKEFKRPCRVPSLSATSRDYDPWTGGYWRGGVWAPTNYMVLSGLSKYGYDKLAFEIAENYLDNVVTVFNRTGTLHENYHPERAEKGIALDDFVGWTGLAPISVMFEYVFGIKPDAVNKKITWRINLCDAHGIKNYPLGDATVNLECEARENADAEPTVHITSDKPITVEIIWNGKSRIIEC